MTKANVIIEGYWSNSLMNGAVLNVGGGMQDSYVRSALRIFPGNNGDKICRRNVTESVGQGTAKVRSSTRS